MMKLSTMQAVVATVNTQWESDLADEILQSWEHDGERAKFWRASTNFVFFFKKLGSKVFEASSKCRLADLSIDGSIRGRPNRDSMPIEHQPCSVIRLNCSS